MSATGHGRPVRLAPEAARGPPNVGGNSEPALAPRLEQQHRCRHGRVQRPDRALDRDLDGAVADRPDARSYAASLRADHEDRSVREVGDWQGKALHISEKLPDSEEAAVIVQAPDGHIVGAARLAGG